MNYERLYGRADLWSDRWNNHHYNKTFFIRSAITVIATPDLDNLIKSITDALNGVAYKDDSQIVAVVSRKMFAPRSNSIVRITSI